MTIVVTASSTEGALSALRSAIQARGYGSDTAPAVQNHALNSVYRRIIGMRRWPFLEVDNNTDIQCVVGQKNYSLAVIPDLLHVDSVRAEIDNEFLELDYKPTQEFRVLQHRFRDNGLPRYWTKIGTNIHIWPLPDRAYTLNVDYVKDPPDLVGDEDQTVIPAAYQDVLVWGAIAELCFRERDIAGSQMAKNEYGTRLLDMMNEYGVRQRQTAAEVVRSGTYDYLGVDEDRLLWQTW